MRKTVFGSSGRFSEDLDFTLDSNQPEDDPVVSIENLRESKMGDRYLEDSEYQTLIEACDPILRALVVLVANTGIRLCSYVGQVSA